MRKLNACHEVLDRLGGAILQKKKARVLQDVSADKRCSSKDIMSLIGNHAYSLTLLLYTN